MSGQDLIADLQAKAAQLDRSIRQLRKSGTDAAEAERDYKILLAQEAFKLREAGTPVGLIDMTAYGLPAVAKARFNRDVTKAVYTANLEAINSLKLQIRIIDNQISREWGHSV